MKSKSFTITLDGKVVCTKSTWNAAMARMPVEVKNRMVPFARYDSYTVVTRKDESGNHVFGMFEWISLFDEPRVYRFTIERTK